MNPWEAKMFLAKAISSVPRAEDLTLQSLFYNN